MKFVMLSVLLSSAVALAQRGSPERVNCKLAAQKYKEAITKKMDIEELIENSTTVLLDEKTADCDKYQDEVVTCQNVTSFGLLSARYHFNTQSGGLRIEDETSGQENYVSWLNQYDLTDSGYLSASTEITNRNGGLLGDARFWQVTVSCWAGKNDWKKK